MFNHYLFVFVLVWFDKLFIFYFEAIFFLVVTTLNDLVPLLGDNSIFSFLNIFVFNFEGLVIFLPTICVSFTGLFLFTNFPELDLTSFVLCLPFITLDLGFMLLWCKDETFDFLLNCFVLLMILLSFHMALAWLDGLFKSCLTPGFEKIVLSETTFFTFDFGKCVPILAPLFTFAFNLVGRLISLLSLIRFFAGLKLWKVILGLISGAGRRGRMVEKAHEIVRHTNLANSE